MARSRRLARAAALALVLIACGTKAPVKAVPAPAAADTAPRAPLDYVPAGGLHWLCVARPQRIFSDFALRKLVLQVFEQDRLDAFAQVSGIDLRLVEAGAIAGYDLGTLYVAALPAPDGGFARARFQDRLSSGAVVKHPRPTLYRIAGTRAGTPRSLLSVNDRLLAFATGDPSLSRIAEAYAERRLKSPTALRGAALSTLPNAPEDALAVVYFPGPFSGEWAGAARGLLGSALALSVVVEASSGTTLVITVTAVGDFPEPQLAATVEATWNDLAHGSTGRLFGLDQAKNVRIVAHLHQLTWSAELPGDAIVSGIRAATIANVPEMFGEHGSAPTYQPVGTPGQAPDDGGGRPKP